MFSLAMLVRLGRITEDDVKSTFAAFQRLDVGNYGKLNSRTVIEGEVMRRRKSLKNLAALSPPLRSGDKILETGSSINHHTLDFLQHPIIEETPPPCLAHSCTHPMNDMDL